MCCLGNQFFVVVFDTFRLGFLVTFHNRQLATMNLDGVTLLGHKLRVVPSNKTEVKLPRGDEQVLVIAELFFLK